MKAGFSKIQFLQMSLNLFIIGNSIMGTVYWWLQLRMMDLNYSFQPKHWLGMTAFL
jgi:hypothetical protein